MIPALWRGDRYWTLAMLLATIIPVATVIRYDFWATSHAGNRFFFFPGAVAAVGVAAWAQLLFEDKEDLPGTDNRRRA